MGGAIRTRTVLLLASAVVMAHVLMLRGLSENLPSYGGPMSTRVFSTRAVQIKAPPRPVVASPRRPASLVPPPKPKAPTMPVQPARAPAEGVMTATARPPARQEALPEPLPPPAAAIPAMPEPPDLPAEPPAVVPGLAPPTLVAKSETPPQMTAATPAPEPTLVANAPNVAPPVPAASEPSSAALNTTVVRALTIPGSIRLAFDAVGKRGRLEYKAMGSLLWLQDGARYDMRMEMGDWILGKRVLSSTGELTGAGLAPNRFSDKFRSERAAHFDRQQGRITFSANTPQAELMAGAQDQISIFAQLASMVAGDPLAYPIGTTVTTQTAGPRDAEPWVFVVERDEMLNLPGGQVAALKLVRKPNKDYDQKVEIWLAPELAFLPARIKITFANGDYLDQQWKSSSPP